MLSENKKILLLFPIPLLIVLGNKNIFFSFLAIVYIIYLMLKNDSAHNYYLGLFLIPNIRIFDIIGVTFVVNILLSIPLFAYCLKNFNKLDYRPFLWTMLLFVIEINHAIVFQYYDDFFSIASCFMGMLFCLLLSFDKNIIIDIQIAWSYFTLGIINSSLVFLISHKGYATDFFQNFILGERFTAYANDPNYFSLYICLCLSFLFTLSHFYWFHYTFALILIVLGLLTGSKMCFIMISFIFIFGYAYTFINYHNKAKLKFSIISFFCFLTGYFYFYDKVIIFISNLIKRAGLEKGVVSADRLTTGRWNIFLDYWNLFCSNIDVFLWGNGFKYHTILNQRFLAHNTYLDILLSWGMIGALILIMIFYLWLGQLEKKRELICYLPIMVLLINFLDLSCLSATMFWWIVSFCVNAARESPQKHNEFINERICIK